MSTKKLFQTIKQQWLVLLIGVGLGFVALLSWHVATASTGAVHYHANFHLYIDGERHEFDNFTYYKEVQACEPIDGVRPESRAHMHDFIDHVVHVHDDGVTWGHFFANLGYTLGNDVLVTRDGLVTNDGDNRLRFILNGEPTRSVANVLIQGKDVLLIDYSDDDIEQLKQRYADIPTDAHHYNEKDDPSACAGKGELTLADRLRSAFNL